MISLRNYQDASVTAIRAAFAKGRRAPLLVLPTGGGKTTVFGYITHNAAAKGRTVFLIAHRAFLVKQIAATLARYGCPHQVIAPHKVVTQCQKSQFTNYGRSWVDHRANVYVCSAQTLIKRLDKLPLKPDLIIGDEGHHFIVGSTWGKIIDHYADARLLLVTATPCRMDGKGLGNGTGGYADELINGVSMRWLIDNGYLSDYKVYAPPTALSLAGVRKRAGDYAKEDLDKAVDLPVITGSAVEHYRKLASGKRAVAFCVSVEHARHVAEQFTASGIKAEYIDGSQDEETRDAIIARLESGETLVLTSCEIISEGFDLPAIECAILLRPTQSTSLFLQQVGRALRLYEGKKYAIVLDHVGAVIAHGLPCEEREWTLDGLVKKKRGATGASDGISVTVCPQCYSVHKAAPVCPACSHVYKPKADAIKEGKGELTELTREDKEQLKRLREQEKEKQRQLKKMEERACRTLDELITLGESRGYQYPKQWAERIFSFRKNSRRELEASF